jgi:hypothetical protein
MLSLYLRSGTSAKTSGKNALSIMDFSGKVLSGFANNL